MRARSTASGKLEKLCSDLLITVFSVKNPTNFNYVTFTYFDFHCSSNLKMKEEFNHGDDGGTELGLCFAELARVSLEIYRHPLRLCALAGEQKMNFNKQVLSTRRGATLPSAPET